MAIESFKIIDEEPVQRKGRITSFKLIDEEPSGSAIGAALRTIGRVPENLVADSIMAVQGQSGASVTDKGIGDKIVDVVDKRNQQLADEYSNEPISGTAGLISRKDIAMAGPNLAFSGVAAGAALAGGAVGAVTSPVTGPVGPIAGQMAGAGLAAQRMAGYQTMNEWLSKKNDESIQKRGIGITPEEEKIFKESFDKLATESGLWEAGPEAIGTTLELALAASPLNFLAKVVPKGLMGKAAKGVIRGAGLLATEQTTETITQQGQQNVESKAGMTTEPARDWASWSDLMKSGKEVLPQVLLLTGTVQGMGAAYRGLSKDKASEPAAETENENTAPDIMEGVEIDPATVQVKAPKKPKVTKTGKANLLKQNIDESEFVEDAPVDQPSAIQSVIAKDNQQPEAAPVVGPEGEDVSPVGAIGQAQNFTGADNRKSWQIRKSEYVSANSDPKRTSPEIQKQIAARHEKLVIEAYGRGEDISSEVLQDYPQLLELSKKQDGENPQQEVRTPVFIHPVPGVNGPIDVPYYAVNPEPGIPEGRTVKKTEVITKPKGKKGGIASYRLSLVETAGGESYVHVEKGKEERGTFAGVDVRYDAMTNADIESDPWLSKQSAAFYKKQTPEPTGLFSNQGAPEPTIYAEQQPSSAIGQILNDQTGADAEALPDIEPEAKSETDAGATPVNPVQPVKETKRQKAEREYSDLVNSLTVDQRRHVGADLIVDAPESPSGQRLKIITKLKSYTAPKEAAETAAKIDAEAQKAETNPTEAQIEAGNYKKAHVNLNGLDITVENPHGSTRSGTDQDGKKWETTMTGHYGYFKRTEGKDGDHVDVIVAPTPDVKSTKAYIVDQIDPKTGKFDEHKIIMGVNSTEEADALYHSNYEKGWKGAGAISEIPLDDLKEWLSKGKRRAPYAKIENNTPDATGVLEIGTDSAPAGVTPEAAKEPWEMTKAEYETAYGKPQKTTTITGASSPHKEAVAIAVNRGDIVPPEVLKDYPDLQAQAPGQAEPAGKPKLLKMDGTVRPDKTPTERPPLPQKSIEVFNKAIQDKDGGKLKEMVHPDNPSWRKMFESHSGKKLPNGVKASESVVDEWLQESTPTPPSAQKEAAVREAKTETGYPLEGHTATMDKARKGGLTIDEYKESFKRLLANKEALAAEYATKTIKQILDFHGGMFAYRHKGDPKASIIKSAVNATIEDYALGRGYSWTYGQGSAQDSIEKLVNETTQEMLDGYRDAISAAKEDRAKQIEGIKDPKTLDDFVNYFNINARMGKQFKDAYRELTDDQQASYDAMAAEKERTAREKSKEYQKSQIHTLSKTVEGEIVSTTHTKTGEPLFVVKAAERVERDVYNEWNSTAKRLGGWYSSFQGSGAVPGFQFKTMENAEAFLAYLKGDTGQAKEAVKARRDAYADDRTQTAVERLNEMADRLEEKADESLNQDRKVNTRRRAGMAASAEAAAESSKALAKTMRNIAAAIESGSVKMLDKVRQKVQVEMLRDYVRKIHYEYLRETYPGTMGYETHKYDAVSPASVKFTTFPQYTAFRSDLAKLGRQLAERDGTKKLGLSILKVADDVTDAYLKFAKKNLNQVSTFRARDGGSAMFKSKSDAEAAISRSGYKGQAIPFSVKKGEHIIIMSPSMAKERGLWDGDTDARITLNSDIGEELIEKVKKAKISRDIHVPWQFENAYNERTRLKAMGIEKPFELRAALREFIGLQEAQKQPSKIKELERAMVGRVKDGLDFFPTPEETAQSMVETAEIKEGDSVLEPSAGMGHIAEIIRAAGVEPDVAEMGSARRELLEAKGFNVVGTDFMDIAGQYDKIIMNPPFSKRRDADHVQHAYGLLKPGGRVVAIMGEGVFFGQDSKAKEFRDWLESVNGTSEKLEQGTFLDPSLPVNTGTNARMVVIDKPVTDTENGIRAQKQARTTDDAAYLKAVKAGDMATAQKMVDAAAKAAGYDVKAYHGTNGIIKVFNHAKSVFKGNTAASQAFWFTTDQPEASEYADMATAVNGGAQNIHKVFISIKKPFITTEAELEEYNSSKIGDIGAIKNEFHDLSNRAEFYDIDNIIKELSKLDAPKIEVLFNKEEQAWEASVGGKDLGNWYTTEEEAKREAAQESATKGRDALANIQGSMMNAAGFRSEQLHLGYLLDDIASRGKDGLIINDEKGEIANIAVFNPDQIKSSDPVTYDDNGNIIPLSERFNAGNEDIRYQTTGYNMPQDIIDKLNAIHPNVEGYVSMKNDHIILHELQMPKDIRKKGLGTEFMEILTGYADAAGKTISLQAAGDYGGSRSGQERFYRRHGFVPNKGRNKDYRISENMIRRPKDNARLQTNDITRTPATDEWNRMALEVLEKAGSVETLFLNDAQFDDVLDQYMTAQDGRASAVDADVHAFYSPMTNKIYVRRSSAKKDTLFHEYAHPVMMQIQKNEPAFYRQGMDLIEGTKYHKKAIADGYGEMSLDEALVQAIGEKGAQIQDAALRNQFVAWLKKLYFKARQLFKKAFGKDITLDDYVTGIAYGMRSGEYRTGSNEGGVKFQAVHHGGPTIWPPEPGFPHGRPRLDKIGTGEGAAAYGWGWYSAESESVGRDYKNRLSGSLTGSNTTPALTAMAPANKSSQAHKLVSAISKNNTLNADDIKSIGLEPEDFGFQDIDDEVSVKRLARYNFGASDYIQKLPVNGQKIDAYLFRDGSMIADNGEELFAIQGPTGALYKLDIPDDVIPKLLDWDKPLSKQSEYVKKAIAPILKGKVSELTGPNGEKVSMYALPSRYMGGKTQDATGRVLYEHLRESLTGGSKSDDTQKIASEYLASIGIPGNRYLDGMSRGKGEGSYNYVIWDQAVLDRVALLERNGEKLDAILMQKTAKKKADDLVDKAMKPGPDELMVDGVLVKLRKSKDMGKAERVIRPPQWIAKRFPKFAKMFERQQVREKERSKHMAETLKETHSLWSLNDDQQAELSTLIFSIENRKIKNIPHWLTPTASEAEVKAWFDRYAEENDIATDDVSQADMGKLYIEQNPESGFTLNDAHYEAMGDWVREKGASEEVVQTFLEIRRSLDKDLVEVWNKLKVSPDVQRGEVAEYRSQILKVANYFPHKRYGNYSISIIDPKQKDPDTGKPKLLYYTHFESKDLTMAMNARKELADIFAEHPEYRDYKISVGKVARLSEEVYETPIPVGAIEQILSAAAERITDPSTAAMFREMLPEATADELKARGWASHAIHRNNVPGYETENLKRALFDYKSGLYGWLTKMDAARSFSYTLKTVRAKQEPVLYGYMKQYAKDMLENSDDVDRLVGNMKAIFFAKYLGGNLKTAALNLSQNIIAGAPRLGMEIKGSAYAKWFEGAMKQIRNQISGSETALNEDEARLLNELYEEGTTQANYTDEVMGQFSGGMKSAWDKVIGILGYPMLVAERFNRSSLALAAFKAAKAGQINNPKTLEALGLSEGQAATYEQAKKFAEGIVLDAHFAYGKGNRPEMFRGSAGAKLMSSAYTFRSFSHNLINLWEDMYRSGGRGRVAILQSIAGTVAIGGMASIPLYKTLMHVIRQATGDDWGEDGILEMIPDGADWLRDLIMYGFPSLLGVNLGGSVGMELPVFEKIQINDSWVKQLSSGTFEFIGIPGAILKDAESALTHISAGRYGRGIEAILPAGLANILKGYRIHTEGQHTASGKPVVLPGEKEPRKIGTAKMVGQMLGFQPLEAAKGWDLNSKLSDFQAFKTGKQGDFADRMAAAKKAKDREQINAIGLEVAAWNKAQRKAGRFEYIVDIERSVKARMEGRQPPKYLKRRAMELKDRMFDE